jgi:hypothetical protein
MTVGAASASRTAGSRPWIAHTSAHWRPGGGQGGVVPPSGRHGFLEGRPRRVQIAQDQGRLGSRGGHVVALVLRAGLGLAADVQDPRGQARRQGRIAGDGPHRRGIDAGVVAGGDVEDLLVLHRRHPGPAGALRSRGAQREVLRQAGAEGGDVLGQRRTQAGEVGRRERRQSQPAELLVGTLAGAAARQRQHRAVLEAAIAGTLREGLGGEVVAQEKRPPAMRLADLREPVRGRPRRVLRGVRGVGGHGSPARRF